MLVQQPPQVIATEARVACGQYWNNRTYILRLIKDDAVRYNKVTEANERSREMGQERREGERASERAGGRETQTMKTKKS